VGRLKERYPRVARYHSLSFDAQTRQLKNEPDEEKREMAASLDGSYLLRTNRQDLSAEEGWRIYASLSHTRRERLPLHEEPPVRASHFPSPRAQGGIAYLSVCLGVPLVGCDRDDVAAPRDSHVMGDGSRPAGDSPDRDDRSADRPEPSIADSSQRDTRAGPEGSLRGAWGAHRDHTSSKNVGAKPAE